MAKPNVPHVLVCVVPPVRKHASESMQLCPVGHSPTATDAAEDWDDVFEEPPDDCRLDCLLDCLLLTDDAELRLVLIDERETKLVETEEREDREDDNERAL